MFHHQKVARVRVFADIQNYALRVHCVHGIPQVMQFCGATDTSIGSPTSATGAYHFACKTQRCGANCRRGDMQKHADISIANRKLLQPRTTTIPFARTHPHPLAEVCQCPCMYLPEAVPCDTWHVPVDPLAEFCQWLSLCAQPHMVLGAVPVGEYKMPPTRTYVLLCRQHEPQPGTQHHGLAIGDTKQAQQCTL